MRISVLVKPGSKENSVTETEDGYLVRLKSPPIDGKANIALVEVLADHFEVRKSAVRVRTGHTARRKIVEIEKPQT